MVKEMRVVGIVGSPRIGGNTERLVSEALAAVAAEGIETELVRLSGLDIKPCNACVSCRTLGYCRIEDDFEQVYQKMVAADGIIAQLRRERRLDPQEDARLARR